MNENKLKEAWEQLVSDKEKISFKSPNLRIDMEREINNFEKRIKLRDRREIIVAACFLLCSITLAIISNGYERLGAIFISVYLVWVIYYLTKAKNQQPSFSISKSIKTQLIEYKSYVLLQQRLVKNVLYWYLLPLIPGVVFFCLGMESKIVAALLLLFNVFVFIYIYRLNQRAAKENYGNLLKELNQAIQNLEA